MARCLQLCQGEMSPEITADTYALHATSRFDRHRHRTATITSSHARGLRNHATHPVPPTNSYDAQAATPCRSNRDNMCPRRQQPERYLASPQHKRSDRPCKLAAPTHASVTLNVRVLPLSSHPARVKPSSVYTNARSIGRSSMTFANTSPPTATRPSSRFGIPRWSAAVFVAVWRRWMIKRKRYRIFSFRARVLSPLPIQMLWLWQGIQGHREAPRRDSEEYFQV
ncbi:hypothetical protein C8R43DRAFT_949325 [Mycena crocata]|nr:hypothetical protein C8R43DRAFT_949325 [Mycena crocata]